MAGTVDREGGLDLSRLDSWTKEEEGAFHDFYMRAKHMTMPAHDFWIEFRPDVLKRYRVQALEMILEAEVPFPKIGILCWLHAYTISGYSEGVFYQVVNAQSKGASRDDILSTLAIAFLQAGPRGMSSVAAAAREYLAEFKEPSPTAWPEGWSADPKALDVGLDYSTRELRIHDAARLRAWYENNTGEVPAHIEFLIRYSGENLKAHWNRLEFTLGSGLPKQMLPVMQLQWNIMRQVGPGIRESLVLARAFGVQRDHVLSAINRAMIYVGPAGMSIVQASAGDIIDTLGN